MERPNFYHSMLAATIVAPGHNMAVPLMPEFIAKQDGAGETGLRAPMLPSVG